MAGLGIEELKHRIGFTDKDARNLCALEPLVKPHLGDIVDALFRWMFADPRASRLFAGGAEQINRQHQLFAVWLGQLFSGIYDDTCYRGTFAIGQAHLRVGLPQHYMFLAMEVVWRELVAVVRQSGDPDLEPKLDSLHKLLTLETAIMLESYKESYATQIRQEERSVAEARVTRSEHLATIGQLAASLAHEIKNPLAGISGAIQVIRDGMRGDDPHRAVIHEILGQISRLDAAVKDLLIYARPKPPELAPCDLAGTISRIIALMRDAPAFRRVPITFNANETRHYIAADNHQLEQLVWNLLVNAAQACSDGQSINVSLSGWNERVRMVIVDTGCGMDETVSTRAFEPFFTTKAKGTGLGLPICKKIVDAHNGTIELRSAAGVGTEVVVEFPAVTPLDPVSGRTPTESSVET